MIQYGGEPLACQRLCQPISKILIGRDIFELDIPFFDSLPLPMIFDVKMLGLAMLYRVSGEINSRLVIPADDSGIFLLKSQFGKELSDPAGFSSGIELPYILGFSS